MALAFLQVGDEQAPDAWYACGGAVGGSGGVVRVTPYRAEDLDRPVWCHTRVQGFGVGGQVSNSVQLNLKSGEMSPYWTVAVNTLDPGQLPAPLDSARFRIGQLSSGPGGSLWTVARWKSDSCPAGGSEAGWDGWLGRETAPVLAGSVDDLGMGAVGWLSRAQGVGSRGVVVAAVGDAVRDRFTVGGNSGRGHGGGDGLAGSGGNWVRLGAHLRLTCTSSGVGPGASSAPVGQRSGMRRPDGFISAPPSRAEFRNGIPLVWSLGV